MKVGDLVLHRTVTDRNRNLWGIILKVYDHRLDHLQDAGSKIRAMASIHWFHIGRSEPMEHCQDRLEIVSGNR